MRALMIPSARLKIDEANDETRSALNKSQRSLGLARATKTPERSHRAETYKLLLHQRCLRGHPAKVSQKSAARYFSVCILTQWTIIFCYSQTATQRPPAPFFFAFLFLLLRACQPWGGLIIRDLNFPQSPAVVPVQLKILLLWSWPCRPTTIPATALLVPNRTYVTRSGSGARYLFM